MADGNAKREFRSASAAEVARTLLSRLAPTRNSAVQQRAAEITGDSRRDVLSGDEERYVVVKELGRGGMGRVEEVFDRSLGRSIARKAALDITDETCVASLVAEAQTCAQLEHPSIVPIHDLTTDASGHPFYTMRVVRGRTLRDVLEANAEPAKPHFSLAQILGILRQVCLAVDYAHSRGVVHRDLKPEHVIVGEFGEVYVVDWGVAHVMETSDVHRTVPEQLIAGSPGYMAPEQALGEPIDARTDVFALGVMLYEILAGQRPFQDVDFRSVRERISRPVEIPPSRRDPNRATTSHFDDLVLACLSRDPARRPASARVLADAIDQYLDRERARIEREREAEAHAREGEAARNAFEALDREAERLRAKSEAMLAELAPWAPIEKKQQAWNLASEAKQSASEAARALARAEAAFTRALGRVSDHRGARRGLAALYYRQFEKAEQDGDFEKRTQYLDLARTYDDGDLSLELANQGELLIETIPSGVTISLARYEPKGLMLRLGELRSLGRTPTAVHLLEAGSYLVTTRHHGREIRFPLVIQRAQVHRLRLDLDAWKELPDGMVAIPKGPFLMPAGPRNRRLVTSEVSDFAIAKFTVTMREYARFLDAIDDPAERERRTPRSVLEGAYLLRDAAGSWRIAPKWIEGEGRKRVPPGRELDLPVAQISWFDALAYTRWLAKTTGLPYRLPASIEWEKAMRGADGRNYPMGNHLDPAFAKLRESRQEVTQPEPVGAFPLDESPYGVRDLAGSMGDWTSTSADGSPLPDLSQEDDPSANDRQAVWRGGAWSITSVDPAMRYAQKLGERAAWIGFRVALSLDVESKTTFTTEPMKRPR